MSWLAWFVSGIALGSFVTLALVTLALWLNYRTAILENCDDA